MLTKVVVPLMPLTEAFELGVACEVFGFDRSDDGLPVYDFSLIAAVPDPIRTRFGYSIDVPYDLDRLDDADLIIMSAGGTATAPDGTFACGTGDGYDLEPLADKLRAAVARGARVASLCTGAFVLGEAGLLDGRRCTTHWRHAARLAERFPDATIDSNVLYVEDDNVYTSAGTAAGIDLCLHIVRSTQGAAVANGIARRMVVPPHRDGGQAQYVAVPVPTCDSDTLAPLIDWIAENLREDLTVDVLAARVSMSARTFARRFQAETGTTPARWISDQRVLEAQRLLESSDLSVDAVAGTVGFGSAAVLRQHFLRLRRTTPQSYRRTFRAAPAPV
ncbi:helix-turn-helix domain-containing protein [Rhodococcus sp. BP-349]|uniref:GlxA family transcriptional regulator n=1 Tax=unclassified Rhodococcus (in: high G+C Gram-positive bacteria) TaxID=192944 RepID=UPI001C9BA12E|nr:MULTISPECIES: helix-turn-helix domain-containing protein [unclassified Rhodococcus (in: high G+C Gram-positive bacteria)]MBY6539049.1 helix-turn-helix domain-containing protein [Rhodococcus sp. BP-363]MBY6543386.1 helix-turn-helix domain-containing protein [Rhodococcus sp. BP-369]MBY6562616.1 helix-turn-helix domain-containing protein [Rhodococcus sp. BP-370]MBY6576908.1 helix-turn-helix domain-containing protein [Rhodococcus sp. BP-364]MBY6586209.1 helix-turn-helix domain-containing protei